MKKSFKVLLVSVCSVVIIIGVIFGVFKLMDKKDNAKVVCTIFPIYDVCRELVGKDNTTYLETTGVDMHSYQASAEDISVISKAEVFIYIGGESEEWVSDVLATLDTTEIKVVCLMDTITALEEEKPASAEGEEKEESEEAEYDEHIWLSVKNMKLMVKAIEETLKSEFTDMDDISTNATEYMNKLNTIDSDFTEAIKDIAISDRFVLCADRFPFRYLVNDYSISYDAAFIGCSAETEASANTIASLIENVNSHNLKYIIRVDNDSIATTIKTDSRTNNGNSIEVLVLESCEAVNSKTAKSLSYLDVIEANYSKMLTAIKNV